jgi:hypothetical protein
MSFTQTVETSKTEAIPAPFPNIIGTATVKVLNGDQSLGPAVALLRMEPGARFQDTCTSEHGSTSKCDNADIARAE